MGLGLKVPKAHTLRWSAVLMDRGWGEFWGLKRREMLLAAAGMSAWLARPSHAVVMSSGTLRTLTEMMQGVEGFNGNFENFKKARVDVQMTLLADNGNSVPLSVDVLSPMTEEEHITDIYLLSQRNPVLVMARFHLGVYSGKALVNTRVRLAGSQKILAVARTNAGQWFYDEAQVVVTESACVDAS
jgi:sulfur-oxidizing protein SoxY